MNTRNLKLTTFHKSIVVTVLATGFALNILAAHADSDQITESFDRSLQENTPNQQTIQTSRVEEDPLYSEVNSKLWISTRNTDNVVSSFDRMMNRTKSETLLIVVHQTEEDPLQSLVNAKLWDTSTNPNYIAANLSTTEYSCYP